jgi:hypothetical protein
LPYGFAAMIETVIQTVLREALVVASAPWFFAAALGLGVGLVWLITWRLFRYRIARLHRRISALAGRVSEYEERLEGASPAQAQARMAALQERVQALTDRTWAPLSEGEISFLFDRLVTLPAHPVKVIYSGPDGARLAASFAALFERLGWPANVDAASMLGTGPGIAVTPADEVGTTLEHVFTAHTDLHVRALGWKERRPDQRTEIRIGPKPWSEGAHAGPSRPQEPEDPRARRPSSAVAAGSRRGTAAYSAPVGNIAGEPVLNRRSGEHA